MPVRFDALGAYVGYDASSPLTTADGKRQVVSDLHLDGPIVAVGDGATDLAMRDVVDTFVAYTGFVNRATVVEHADAVVDVVRRPREFHVVVNPAGRLVY